MQLNPDQFTGSRKKHHRPRSDADRVFAQLSKDYPKHTLAWVHDLKWSGPEKISLNDIDWEHEQMWKASHDESHVHHFVEMIEHGEEVKPIIAIARPGKPTDMIPDGHHRALAFKEKNKAPVGWVGKAKSVVGPWDELHDYQFKDTDKDKKLQ